MVKKINPYNTNAMQDLCEHDWILTGRLMNPNWWRCTKCHKKLSYREWDKSTHTEPKN